MINTINSKFVNTITLWAGMVGSLYADQSFGSITETGISWVHNCLLDTWDS